MERIRLLGKMLLVLVLGFLVRVPPARAEDDSGFTMSSGTLLGQANGTQGA